MLKAKSSENFLSPNPKICKILTFYGPWRSGGMKSCDFYCKRHILAWIHVVWAILRQNRLRGLTARAKIEKSQKVTRGSHRNDVSPLTQGLRYRAACDKICSIHRLNPHLYAVQIWWIYPLQFQRHRIFPKGATFWRALYMHGMRWAHWTSCLMTSIVTVTVLNTPWLTLRHCFTVWKQLWPTVWLYQHWLLSSLQTVIYEQRLHNAVWPVSVRWDVLVILDVFIETAKLASLKHAECHEQNNAEDEWVDTTQHQVLHLKVTTCRQYTRRHKLTHTAANWQLIINELHTLHYQTQTVRVRTE